MPKKEQKNVLGSSYGRWTAITDRKPDGTLDKTLKDLNFAMPLSGGANSGSFEEEMTKKNRVLVLQKQTDLLEMIEKDYTDELASVASEGSFYKLLNTGSKTPAEAVIEFVNEDTEVVADFLVIAPRLNETNDHKVSSLTNNLLRQTKTNLVIVKR